jgi:outer membrane protein OmpA-like peptidoglycan-associated protein/tetratricopeptide (TPR) repeat protein
MKKFITILPFFVIFWPGVVHSQNFSSFDSLLLKHKEQKADKLFKNYAYHEAIQAFEHLTDKGYQTDSLTRNLAVSYYKTANTKKSEELFRKLIDRNNYLPSDLYLYIQSLKYNKKYEEADIWMEKYVKENPNDSRGNLQKMTASFVRQLSDNERYNIENVNINSGNSDFGAIDFAGDVVFASSRYKQSLINYEDDWKKAPYFALYKVRKEDASVVRIKIFPSKFNSIYNDGPVCFNTAEDEIFVTRNNYKYHIPRKGKQGINNLKILYAKRIGPGSWSPLSELPFDNNDYSCGHPALSADGNILYFASDMPGGSGGTDIYYVTRSGSGWSAPVNLGPTINTEGDEMFPFIDARGILYFASNGREGMGGLDIYISQKTNEGTYIVKNMGVPLNSSADDFGLYLRKDERSGYFASNREGGKGDDDIYSFDVKDPVTFGWNITGTVVDSVTHEMILNAEADLLSDKQLRLQSKQMENSNEFAFSIEKPQQYLLHISREGYTSKTLQITPEAFNKGNVIIPVELTKDSEYGIVGDVFMKGTKERVPGVSVRIEHSSEVVATVITNDKADFRVQLQPETDYQIVFLKPGFLTKRIYYSTKGRTPGYVNVNEFIQVEIQKLELGAIIEIPNIYYDLAKWNIRPDASVELDKVVEFLNDNPSIKAELGSHTDSRGSDMSNQILSQKRAQSAVEYIVKKGIDIHRITAKGYGESKLKNRCSNGVVCSEQEHQQNRRTEIMVTGF